MNARPIDLSGKQHDMLLPPGLSFYSQMAMYRRDLWTAAICLIVMASFVGCGKRDRWARVLVSGSVTYKGQPVEKGQIRFIPLKDSSGPVTVDPIDQGKYTTNNTGGVPVGAHRVEILGYDAKEYANAPTGPGAPPVRQLLPKKYNLNSELTVNIEATSKGKTCNFELTP